MRMKRRFPSLFRSFFPSATVSVPALLLVLSTVRADPVPVAGPPSQPPAVPEAKSLGDRRQGPEPAPEIVSPHAYEWAVGARYGYPVDNDFAFWEVFGAWSPEGWYYDFNDAWRFRGGVTAGIGALRADNNDLAFFFHAGPFLEIVHRPTGIRIVGRSEPAYMSRHSLGGVDLGEDFEFVSAIGVFWTPPGSHWTTGVAIQHISNGGISDVNPGTEHVVFSLACAF